MLWCPVPKHELDYIEPLDGVATMLELGNKGNSRGTYKAYFTARGIKHTFVDWNGQDGALKLDLRKPLDLGRYDMVTNIGTTEHVEGQLGAWRNIYDAAERWLVCVLPVPGEWPGHGLYYPPADWFHTWARLNGFHVWRMGVHGNPGKRCHYVRMIRRASPGFHHVEVARNR